MTTIYCFKHEGMFPVDPGERGVGHEFISPPADREAGEWGFCYFDLGFAFSPPPEAPVIEREPFVEELEEANRNAEELALELEPAEA